MSLIQEGLAIDSSNGSVPSGKIATENFQKEIMSVLDISKSKHAKGNVEYYLAKLIREAQELNGVQKNNLKPQGSPEQNDLYNRRLIQKETALKNYALFVDRYLGKSGTFSLVQDSNSGLYKLCVNNKIYDIPEREVKIGILETEDGDELTPEIID